MKIIFKDYQWKPGIPVRNLILRTSGRSSEVSMRIALTKPQLQVHLGLTITETNKKGRALMQIVKIILLRLSHEALYESTILNNLSFWKKSLSELTPDFRDSNVSQVLVILP